MIREPAQALEEDLELLAGHYPVDSAPVTRSTQEEISIGISRIAAGMERLAAGMTQLVELLAQEDEA